jgi:hypothetical protein
MDKWENFHLSEIYYKKKALEPIKDAYNEYHKINNSDSVKVSGFEDIVVSLYGFHKSPIYNYEQEIRLLYVHRNDYINTFNEVIFPHVRNNKKTGFVELDLAYKNICLELQKENPTRRQILPLIKPNITISKIVLGYRHTDNSKNIISTQMASYDEYPNKRIPLSISTLIKYYQ